MQVVQKTHHLLGLKPCLIFFHQLCLMSFVRLSLCSQLGAVLCYLQANTRPGRGKVRQGSNRCSPRHGQKSSQRGLTKACPRHCLNDPSIDLDNQACLQCQFLHPMGCSEPRLPAHHDVHIQTGSRRKTTGDLPNVLLLLSPLVPLPAWIVVLPSVQLAPLQSAKETQKRKDGMQ